MMRLAAELRAVGRYQIRPVTEQQAMMMRTQLHYWELKSIALANLIYGNLHPTLTDNDGPLRGDENIAVTDCNYRLKSLTPHRFKALTEDVNLA